MTERESQGYLPGRRPGSSRRDGLPERINYDYGGTGKDLLEPGGLSEQQLREWLRRPRRQRLAKAAPPAPRPVRPVKPAPRAAVPRPRKPPETSSQAAAPSPYCRGCGYRLAAPGHRTSCG